MALVTGASRGIGAAIVQGLSDAGANAIGIGRSEKPCEAVTGGVEYRQCDIADADRFGALCSDIFSRHGRIDVLVNAAGITLPNSDGVNSVENFERTLSINLTAIHRCCELVASYMRKTNGGSIINVTSIGSVLGFPNNPAYVASKGGLRMLSRALAVDYASDQIRVNNLAPGYIRTDMTEASFQDPVKHQDRLQRMLVKRWGSPEDLIGAAIYLASDASSYVTGIDLFVDGGWTAKGM